jgi:hypothetical protein
MESYRYRSIINDSPGMNSSSGGEDLVASPSINVSIAFTAADNNIIIIDSDSYSDIDYGHLIKQTK